MLVVLNWAIGRLQRLRYEVNADPQLGTAKSDRLIVVFGCGFGFVPPRWQLRRCRIAMDSLAAFGESKRLE